MLDFEMRLLDTEDRHLAWKSLAKKLGVKLLPPNKGMQTGQHDYRDANGDVRYQVRRYEDGSAPFYSLNIAGKWRAGLKRVRRVPYNLPDVLNGSDSDGRRKKGRHYAGAWTT